MTKYELIERLRIYYLMPSYWRKRRRKCWHCGLAYNKNLGYVNYGIAHDETNRLWHEFCYSITQNPTVNYPVAQNKSNKRSTEDD